MGLGLGLGLGLGGGVGHHVKAEAARAGPHEEAAVINAPCLGLGAGLGLGCED